MGLVSRENHGTYVNFSYDVFLFMGLVSREDHGTYANCSHVLFIYAGLVCLVSSDATDGSRSSASEVSFHKRTY